MHSLYPPVFFATNGVCLCAPCDALPAHVRRRRSGVRRIRRAILFYRLFGLPQYCCVAIQSTLLAYQRRQPLRYDFPAAFT